MDNAAKKKHNLKLLFLLKILLFLFLYSLEKPNKDSNTG